MPRLRRGWRKRPAQLLDSPETADEVARFAERGLPLVQLMRPQRAVASATLTVDAAPGIAAAIEHLVALGHRRIGFLGHGGEHPVDRSRREAFIAALARHGLRAQSAWIRLMTDYSSAESHAATLALLASPERPTAIFAAGDNLALGVLKAVYDLRLRVPNDLSLVSYDDILAPHLPPPLTSVRQPLQDLAEQAITLIAGQLEQAGAPAAPAPQLVLPTQLVIRNSTTPPRP